MTNDMMSLRALMEKSPDADLLREMIPDQVRDLGRSAPDGAGGGRPDRRGSRREERRASRSGDGYRDRDWETRAGTVELRIPVSKVMNATWQRCRVHFMRNVMPMPANKPAGGWSRPS